MRRVRFDDRRRERRDGSGPIGARVGVAEHSIVDIDRTVIWTARYAVYRDKWLVESGWAIACRHGEDAGLGVDNDRDQVAVRAMVVALRRDDLSVEVLIAIGEVKNHVTGNGRQEAVTLVVEPNPGIALES